MSRDTAKPIQVHGHSYFRGPVGEPQISGQSTSKARGKDKEPRGYYPLTLSLYDSTPYTNVYTNTDTDTWQLVQKKLELELI